MRYQFSSEKWYLQPAMAIIDSIGGVLFYRKKKQVDVKSILVIQMGNFGDIMVTLPTLKGFRNAFPLAKIDVLMKESMKTALPKKRNFNTIFAGFNWMRADGKLASEQFRKFMKSDLFKELKSKNYDLIVDVHGDPRNIWLAWKLGGKLRAGFDIRGLGFFLTHKAHFNPEAHIIDRYFETVKCFKDLPVTSITEFGMWLPKIKKNKSIVLHPGTGLRLKSWTHSNWAWIADHFIDEGYEVMFTFYSGNNNEIEDITEIKSRMEYANLVKTKEIRWFDSLLEVLQSCDFFISPDTGPAHLAQMIGTPHLTLFGPSMAKRWGYEGSYIEQGCECVNKLECKYGFENRCMSKLEPSEVYAKAKVMLNA